MSVVCGTIITLLLAIAGPWFQRWAGFHGFETSHWQLTDAGGRWYNTVQFEYSPFFEVWKHERVEGITRHYDHSAPDLPVPAIARRPTWAENLVPSPPREWRFDDVSVCASGWPFRAGAYLDWTGGHSPARFPGGSFEFIGMPIYGAILTRKTAGGYEFYVVPLCPIWPGLLLNIAFWTAIFAVPTLVITEGRHARLRRQGLCLKCRYDLRGSTDGRCPECGTQDAIVAPAKPDVAPRTDPSFS